MEYEFLKSLEVIFLASAAVILLLYKLKVPSLVGFIIAGIIIGPQGVGLIKDTYFIQILAEIGVVLLLFTIGIEFSMTKLVRIKKAVVGGGGMQVLLTILLSALITYIAIDDINKSIFFGFLYALSSTAIVLKLLVERGEIDSPHGHTMVGILIFQDLCIVPLMLLIPVLSGNGIDMFDVGEKIGKAAVIIIVVLLSARWMVPTLLHQIVRTKSRELFLTTIILLCLGIALLTSRFGLSLALGAFLAGLIISESEYAHQALADILPFKDSFMGLFFVSIGMLMDTGFVIDNSLRIAEVVVFIFILKIITGTVSSLLIGNSLRSSIIVGFGLAQIGEFSFVLAVAGKASGLISEEFYQIFLSSSIVTMIMTPLVLNTAPSATEWITARPLLKKLFRGRRSSEVDGIPRKKHNHVVIIGFGLNGRNLAKVLRVSEIPYVVLEMNSDTVREMKKKGEPIYYGDGTSKEILHKLNITKARLLVVAISDPIATRSIVAIARKENPDIYIIVRTRYLAEVDDLKNLGANEVIPEEFETSVEIFSRVLHHYHIPRNVITEHIDDIRKDNYMLLRTVKLPRKYLADRYELLKELDTETYMVKEMSKVEGHSIKELRFRTETGVTIIAIQRGEKIHQNPTPDFILKTGDIVLLIGKKEDINRAIEYLESDRFLISKHHE
ncbi:MAG TPA: cation:proton antiporter [Thermodesulfovibrionales bacterium]|nr:cation:proton antiporter [Thermodesulfovibrionales bacterium]